MIAEIMPWYLNGTLANDETKQVRSHLAECPKCQQELGETKFALALHQQHLPVEVLVDYAFGLPTPEFEQEVIDSHLAACHACLEQFALIEESQQLEKGDGKVLDFRPPLGTPQSERASARSLRFWRYAAIAASLIGFLGLVGWMLNWQKSSELRANLNDQQRVLSQRLGSLEAENQRLRQSGSSAQDSQAEQQIAQLQAHVKELTKELNTPQMNIPVLEVFPQEMAKRGEKPAVTNVEIPSKAKTVALILNSQSTIQSSSYSLEVVDARNRILWSDQGLLRHRTGDYTISLPAESLPPGSYTFNVYGRNNGKRVLIESYRILISKT